MHTYDIATLVFLHCIVLINGKMDNNTVLTFLNRYGYTTDMNVNNEEFSKAISNFQKMSAIEITGKINKETENMMKQKRCAVKDINSSMTTGWNKTRLTYRIVEYTNKLKRHEVDKTIVKSFAAWSRYTPLIFSRKGYDLADINIYFNEEGHPEKPFDNETAYALFPKDGGSIYFNDKEEWSTTISEEGTSLFHVAIHEIGHALGLEHLDSISVMFSNYWTGFNDLLIDDVEAIQTIYGKRTKNINNNFSID